MRRPSAFCTTTTASLLFLATLCLSSVSARHHAFPRFANDTESICRPFGECEPCPHDYMREPFCQPFGNRRRLHCLPSPPAPGSDLEHPIANSNPDNRPAAVTHSPGSYAVDPNEPHRHADGELLEGETVAWESCGRIVVQERADFWEFVACNLLFVCIALVLVILRSKRMSAVHARQLATRIGLARGYG
ncbi:hypothetical protein EDB92DRAFT_1333701 [Lactarius akahatsu]|uniref:Uncharacterized protein n=1 Tax=Lactarius akahatsu TaxID=416441 RepID=A0AAD4QGU1_9AGAM|nr:hypothetical protein EDB92DRAFT_1333701 [Lactarius akahatsu]